MFPTETAWRTNQFFTVSANIVKPEVARLFVGQFTHDLEQDGNVYIYKELVSYQSILN